MKIKVCGMQDPENIKQIGSLNIDFMGFIFYEKSKRFAGDLNPDKIFLPEKTNRVGVFVNESEENILETVPKYRINYVQLHGDELPEFCKLISEKVKVIKAFQTDDDFDFTKLDAYSESCDFFIFDTKSKDYGGSGKKFDWSVLEKYMLDTPFLLSGGIKPEDLEAIQNFNHPQCAGIDVNSGFEDALGLKNFMKLRDFTAEVL